MEQNSNCEEILENIKASLHYCASNTMAHKFNRGNGVFYPIECENIIRFERSLEATKTTIQYKQPFLYLDKQYTIKYDVLNRHILIEQ